MRAKLVKENIGYIDNLFKPKSEEDIIKDLSNLSQEEKDEKLIEASRIGQLDILKLLIKIGANVNAKDSYGYTPLLYASRYNKLEVVKLLLKAGADINVRNKGDTALILAFINGHEEIVDILTNNIDV